MAKAKVNKDVKKKQLHPALQANADKLKNREPLSPGNKSSAAAKKRKLGRSTGKKRG